jgi:hypothetical protein
VSKDALFLFLQKPDIPDLLKIVRESLMEKTPGAL